jgi:sulfur-carrier protein
VEVSVQVVLPGVLADLAGGSKHLDVDPGGPTLGDLLDTLAERHPLLGRRIRDETGQVRRFVNVYVDGDDVRFTQGLATQLRDGAEVQVLPSVAGG